MIAAARWLVVVIALCGAVLDVLVLAGVTRPAIIGIGPATILTAYSPAFERVSGVSPGSSAKLGETRAALARLTGGSTTPIARATSPFAVE